jgi:hypothetical protein
MNQQEFLQLLFAQGGNPQVLQQLAGELAMKAPAPSMQPPGMDMMLTPPQQGFSGLAPMQGMPQPLMPGESMGMPEAQTFPVANPGTGVTETQVPSNPMGALNPQQMMMFAKMLEPPKAQYIGNPAPPAPRGLSGNMAQLSTPQMGLPPSLAMLLQGRR